MGRVDVGPKRVLRLPWLAALLLQWAGTGCRAGTTTLPLYRTSRTLDWIPGRGAKNIAYYTVLQLGTPPQQYTFDVDTGSSDLWVTSATCINPACVVHTRFNSSQSNTYQNAGRLFSIRYGIGELAGEVGFDTLTLGTPALRVTGQGLGLAFTASADFFGDTADGLLGLGFPAISNLGVPPPFFRMLAAGVLDTPVFGLSLEPSLAAEPAGELTFGFTNQRRYQGELQWHPVTEQRYWQVALGGVKVGGNSVALTSSSAIVDSGTTAIVVNEADAAAIHAGIPGVTYFKQTGANGMSLYVLTRGCRGLSSLPSVTFQLGNASYTLTAEQWVEQAPDTQNTCLSTIRAHRTAGKLVVLGAPFMRAWYTGFRVNNTAQTAELGFARPVAVASSRR